MQYEITRTTKTPNHPQCLPYNEYRIVGIEDKVFSARGSCDAVALDAAQNYVTKVLNGEYRRMFS